MYTNLQDKTKETTSKTNEKVKESLHLNNTLKKVCKYIIEHIGVIHLNTIIAQALHAYAIALFLTAGMFFCNFFIKDPTFPWSQYLDTLSETSGAFWGVSFVLFKILLISLIVLELLRFELYVLYCLFNSIIFHKTLQVHYQGWLTISNIKKYKHPLLDKLFMSLEEKESYEKELELISIHEAGHAVAAYLLDVPVEEVSMPYKENEAYTAVTLPSVKYTEDLEKEIQILYAGAVAEKMIYKKISAGCTSESEHSDLSKAEDRIKEYRSLCLLTCKEGTDLLSCSGAYLAYKGTLDFMAETEALLKGKEELILSVAQELRKHNILFTPRFSTLMENNMTTEATI